MKQTRRIYIRHADKEYANGDSEIYKHDPGITESGIEKAKKVARHLIETWGQPNLILTSPYKRTRETAAILESVVDNNIKIHIDKDLSEYLGNHRYVPIDVTENTLVYDPPHPENFSELQKRVNTHHRKITEYSKRHKGKVIWIITHGLIIKQIANLIGFKMKKDFPTLSVLSIVDGDEEEMTSEITIFHDNSARNLSKNSSDENECSESDNDSESVGYSFESS